MSISLLQQLILLLSLLQNSAANAAVWQQVSENISEYSQIMNTTTGLLTHCLLLAQSHQAVMFNEASHQCEIYECKLGSNGCRKCRNFVKNNLTQVWLQKSSSNISLGCWRTFQHRVDASVDFYRNWTQYVIGFGQGEDANFWLGLNKIHELTKVADRRVRWEFSDWNDTLYWAENEFLRVENEVNEFRAWLGAFDAARSNVAQSSLESMSGMRFTTFDNDNDGFEYSCAVDYSSAWWYRRCHAWNPNGRYFTPPQALNLQGDDWGDGLVYDDETGPPLHVSYSMKTFECLLWHQL